jgi:hypothetical protein
VRWIVVGATALAAAAAAVLLVTRADSPKELLPDLRQLPPGGISVVEVDGEHRLVFLSAVDNVGRAPIVVEGRRESGDEATMAVEQVVTRTDGSTGIHAVGAEIRYVSSETHEHWHLLDFEHYSLHRAGDGRVVVHDRKTGFCLGDRFDSSEGEIPGEPPQAVWTGECGRGGRGLLSVREGISPGYGDDYVPALEGQYLVVDGLPAGRYRLWHRVNPLGVLLESNYSNNGASLLLDLSWEGGKASVSIVEP